MHSPHRPFLLGFLAAPSYLTAKVSRARTRSHTTRSLAFTKTSLTVAPEQLPSTIEDTQLCEACARNGLKIRFVPYEQVPNEPSCTGTDYKPLKTFCLTKLPVQRLSVRENS